MARHAKSKPKPNFPPAVAVRRLGRTELWEYRRGGARLGIAGARHDLQADALAVLGRIVEVIDRFSENKVIICKRDGRLYPIDAGCRRKDCECVSDRLVDIEAARRKDISDRRRCW